MSAFNAFKIYYKYDNYRIAITKFTNTDLYSSIGTKLWSDIHVACKNCCSLAVSINHVSKRALLEYIKSDNKSDVSIVNMVYFSIAFIKFYSDNQIVHLHLNTIDLRLHDILVSPYIDKNWLEHYFKGYLASMSDNIEYTLNKKKINDTLPTFNKMCAAIPRMNSFSSIYLKSSTHYDFLTQIKRRASNGFHKLVDNYMDEYMFTEKSISIYNNRPWIIALFEKIDFDINKLLNVNYLKFRDKGILVYKSNLHYKFIDLYLKRYNICKIYYT
jgi:hypothetical protein